MIWPFVKPGITTKGIGMKSHKRLQTMIFGLLIVMFSTCGCAFVNSLPFIATQTPYPTYTPFPPTATPVPARWTVEILSTIKAQTFGTWYYTQDQPADFIIVTIEYTYHGQETTEFSPMSVVLLFQDGSSFPGFGAVPQYYQTENNNTVVNLLTQGAFFTYIKPEQIKIEKFGWGITPPTDTKYRLLFPETPAIDIVVEN